MSLDLRILTRDVRCSSAPAASARPGRFARCGNRADHRDARRVWHRSQCRHHDPRRRIRVGELRHQRHPADQERHESSYRRRILLKFDTQNYIPAGAVINSAQLSLTLKGADDSTLRPIAVYRVTKSFLARQATWLDYRDALSWSNAGGDLGAVTRRRTSATPWDAVYKFDLTELVQQSVNGTFGSRYTRLVLIDTGPGSSKALRASTLREVPTPRCGRSW